MTNFRYLFIFKYFHIVGHNMFFIRFVELQGIPFIYCYCFSVVEHAHVLKNVFQKPYFFIAVITNENVFILMSQFRSVFAFKSCFSFFGITEGMIKKQNRFITSFSLHFFS